MYVAVAAILLEGLLAARRQVGRIDIIVVAEAEEGVTGVGGKRFCRAAMTVIDGSATCCQGVGVEGLLCVIDVQDAEQSNSGSSRSVPGKSLPLDAQVATADGNHQAGEHRWRGGDMQRRIGEMFDPGDECTYPTACVLQSDGKPGANRCVGE